MYLDQIRKQIVEQVVLGFGSSFRTAGREGWSYLWVLVAGEVPGTWRSQLAQVRVWVVGFVQQDEKRRYGHTGGCSSPARSPVKDPAPGVSRRAAGGGRAVVGSSPLQRNREGRERTRAPREKVG